MTIRTLGKLFLAMSLIGFWPVAASVAAENSLKKESKAFSIEVGDEDFILGGRYFIGPDMAVLGEFGFLNESVSNGVDNSGSSFSFGIGVRKYLSTNAEFVPFVGAGFSYLSLYNSATDDDVNGFELDANFGAEYFFARRFSVEGSVGLAYQTFSDDATDVEETRIGTFDSSLGVNFYF
jgi:hypothetical protein